MDTRTSRIRRIANTAGLLAGGLLLAALTACGAGGSGSDDDAATTSATASPSASPTDATTEESPVTDSPSLPPLDETSKPVGDSQTTITGTIQAGVESGCLILEFEGTVYGVFGSFDSSVVYAGAQVTLHGVVDTGMMSTCQQGTPFVVSEAETAG
ncbi:hypothetical protein GCM10009830_32840 [Glycomyces endophyticus]|uniref:Uncharacterized protein n=1 Tax=Glycomyces endophyticus TaxID=480996 RepID=A0ABP4T6D6_9ACTN